MKNYFKWLFTEHKYGRFKFLLLLIGITQCVSLTDDFYYEYYYYDMPLYPLIMGYVALYGFTIGIALQPYSIYKDLKK
jgi:hypothetical protein